MEDLNLLIDEYHKAGHTFEQMYSERGVGSQAQFHYRLFQSQQHPWSYLAPNGPPPCYTAVGTQPGRGVPMDIGAVDTRKETRTCFGCSDVGHICSDCSKNPKCQDKPAPHACQQWVWEQWVQKGLQQRTSRKLHPLPIITIIMIGLSWLCWQLDHHNKESSNDGTIKDVY